MSLSLNIRKPSFWVFLFFLSGLIIRVYRLGDHNLWFDEFFSLKAITEPNLLGIDCNPPFYYVLLSNWVRDLGPFLARHFVEREFILRSLSAVSGAISIPLIYKLGKSFFDARTGLISALILTVSPIHIWYSQEARGYSLSGSLTMLAVYLFILASEKGNICLWTGFIVSALLAVFTNYFSLFAIILIGMLIAFRKNRYSLKQYLVSLCFIFFGLLPLLPLLFRQINRVINAFWIPKPSFQSIAISIGNFNAGYNAPEGIYYLASVVFTLLFLLGIIFLWKEKRDILAFFILVIFLPPVVTFLISRKIPVYLDRQMILFSPFYYIIVAAGLGRIKTRFITLSAYLLILITALLCLRNYFTYQAPLSPSYHIGVHAKKPIKPIADYIVKNLRKGDLVAYSDFSIVSIFFYMPDVPRDRIAYFFIESELKNERYPYISLQEIQRFRLQEGRVPNIINLDGKPGVPGGSTLGMKNLKDLSEFQRIWLISSSWARDGNLDAPVESVRGFMRKNYALLEAKEFDGIFVDLLGDKMLD